MLQQWRPRNDVEAALLQPIYSSRVRQNLHAVVWNIRVPLLLLTVLRQKSQRQGLREKDQQIYQRPKPMDMGGSRLGDPCVRPLERNGRYLLDLGQSTGWLLHPPRKGVSNLFIVTLNLTYNPRYARFTQPDALSAIE